MSRLTRDGTAKPVSRNQFHRRERGQEKFPRSADHEQDWQAHPVDLYSAIIVMIIHAYIYTVGCTVHSRLLSGHLGFVAGTLRGSLFPICCGLVGVLLT